MVIADEIPRERKRRWSKFGVSNKEIPDSKFLDKIKDNIAKINFPIEVTSLEEGNGKVRS